MRNAQHRHWAASGASGFGEPVGNTAPQPWRTQSPICTALRQRWKTTNPAPAIGTQTANEAASAVEVDYLLVMFFVIMT
ncbi:hypothetical protein GJR93_03705 [Aminobacter sp. MDW-2]|nr:hypothetical protein [Aminobacter sp. MDW-2]